MSMDDYASLNTARLLELFAEGARQVGVGRKFSDLHKSARSGDWSGQTGKLSDEARDAMKRGLITINAVAKALRARGALSEIKGLFDDDDPDVRYCAVMQFEDVDPDLAACADHSLYAQLPTREVLALRRRARTPPASQPTLQEMSDNALVVRFEDAAAREGATQFLDPIDEPEDQETQNRIAIELIDIMKEMKSRGLLSRLAPLLSSGNLTVRFRAAQASLRLSEQQAVTALESVIVNGKFDESMPARDALDNWRKGKCLIDGL